MSLTSVDPTPSPGQSLLELYPSVMASISGEDSPHDSRPHWNSLAPPMNSTLLGFEDVQELAAGKPASSHSDPPDVHLVPVVAVVVVAALDCVQPQLSF